MRLLSSPLLLLCAVLSLTAPSCFAQVGGPGGLSISLTTSGTTFVVGDPPSSMPPASARKLGIRGFFYASVLLTNRGAEPVTFSARQGENAVFKLRVLDAAGQVVWDSAPGTSSGPTTTDGGEVILFEPSSVTSTLRRGQVWRQTVKIPLKTADAWLIPGAYSLEAGSVTSDTGTPTRATLPFELLPIPVTSDPAELSGIEGHLTVSVPLNLRGTIEPIAAVSVVEFQRKGLVYDHPPFVWHGVTDSNGRFKVATPAGEFIVTGRVQQYGVRSDLFYITTPDPLWPTPFYFEGSTKGYVQSGASAPVDLHVEMPRQARVLRGRIVTMDASFFPPSGMPDAEVRVEQIASPGQPLPSSPFVWTGKSGSDGKFTLVPPAGRYRLTAVNVYAASKTEVIEFDVVDDQVNYITLIFSHQLHLGNPVPTAPVPTP